jgi:hypothetical protein
LIDTANVCSHLAPDDRFGYNEATLTSRAWVRAFLWVSALLLGGIGLVVLAYTLIAGANLLYALAAVVLALLAVAYMILIVVNFERSRETGNTRWYDRERRGF